MKQIYGVGSTDSPTPRYHAATAGLSLDDRNTALALADYSSAAHEKKTTRLALLPGPRGRTLLHVVPDQDRFFAHILLEVPETVDPQLAVQTWGSPLWQRQEVEVEGDLPDLPYPPVADQLDDAGLRRWLATPARRDMLEYVLTALLGTNKKIVVAAPADDIAQLVYAVTRALPQGLLEAFTFSTYENEPGTRVRLAGHDCGTEDLPESCYEECAAYHPLRERRTELQVQVPFAAFCAGVLAGDDPAPLDEVKVQWQKLGLKEARQFDLVYRLTRGTGIPSKEEAAEALKHPPLATWISTRSDALKQFLEWAIDDRQFAVTSFTRVVQVLRQKPDVVAKLSQVVRDFGMKSLKAGELERTANTFEVVLPMVAPAKAGTLWGEVLAQTPEPELLSWPMRGYLLPRLIQYKRQAGTVGVDRELEKWIDLPSDRLEELLHLDLPRVYQLAACRKILAREGEPSSATTATLAAHASLALTLLQPAGNSEADAVRPAKLYEALLEAAPDQEWFNDLFAHASDYPVPLLHKFFEITLTARKIDAEKLVRHQGEKLISLFAGRKGLDSLAETILSSPPDDLLQSPSLCSYLEKMRDDASLDESLQGRIDSFFAVKRWLDDPQLESESLRAAAEGLAVTPPVVPAATKSKMFDAVATLLANRAHEESLQDDLELVLVHTGSQLANDPADLYENLLRELRTRGDAAKKTPFLHAFLALALGATKREELQGKLEGLDGPAYALASDAAKRGGVKLLDELTRRSENWPKSSRTQWSFLVAAVRPRGASALMRDALFYLAGAATVGAVWLSKLLLDW